MHPDDGETDGAAADQSGSGASAVGGDRQSDRGEKHRDEERAAGQRRVVADADVRLERQQRNEMRGPHDRAGGKP